MGKNAKIVDKTLAVIISASPETIVVRTIETSLATKGLKPMTARKIRPQTHKTVKTILRQMPAIKTSKTRVQPRTINIKKTVDNNAKDIRTNKEVVTTKTTVTEIREIATESQSMNLTAS